jgi:hypothetical protein
LRRISAQLLLSAALALGSGATPAADEAIPTADVRATVLFLASPELGGRGAAEPGGAVAAAFVASRLEALGWLPAGDADASGRGFLQSVPAVEARLDLAASELRWVGPAATRIPLDGPAARAVPDRAATVEFDGDIVFAGFGIRAPEHRHDDYDGLDVKDRVVLVRAGEPGELDGESPWNGARPTRHLPVASKRALAASLGARALLVAPNPDGRIRSVDELAGTPRPPVWLGARDAPAEIPVIYVGQELAAELMGERAAGLRGPPGAIPGRRVAGRIVVRERRDVTLRNVVARLGAGRGLDGEVIVLGAHWDHLGAPAGVLHPGADDNATGIAALLAVAAALRAAPPAGGREVVIAAWTGEEHGLLGSTHFTQHPVVPLERIATAVNLDMLGRDNLDRGDYAGVLQVIYSAAAPVLRDLARAANAEVGFDLRFYPSLRFRPVSDHAAFARVGVPIVYPFSGYHADYHAPGDTPGKVLPDRVARAARFVERLVRRLAESDGPIRLDPAIRVAPAPDPFETPYGG